MQTSRATRGAILLVALFVLQSYSVFFTQQEEYLSSEDEYNQIEWVRFDLREGVYNDAKGIYDYTETLEQREVYADSSIGIFDDNGLILNRPVSVEMLQSRPDLNLLLISNQVNLLESREKLSLIHI